MTYHEQAIFQDTLNTHGQVLLPKGLRRVLELHPGDRVQITADSATQTINIQKIENGKGHAG